MVQRQVICVAAACAVFGTGSFQRAAVTTQSASNAQQQAARAIVDVHVHAFISDARFGSRVTMALTGEAFVAAADAPAHAIACRNAMDRLNIVKAVVSGDNDAVRRWKEAMPERVLVGYTIDRLPINMEALRKERAAGRLDVIGELAPQLQGMAANDPRLEQIYAIAEELDIPIGFHLHPGPSGAPYIGFPKLRAALGDPLALEEPIVRHPKLRLYVMHAGWPFLERMMALLYAHPQVYVDIGVIDWTQPKPEFDRYLRTLVEAGYGRRIMFGSDQMVWCDAIARAVHAIESADYLSPQQKEDILFNNAVRFLRLDGLQQPG